MYQKIIFYSEDILIKSKFPCQFRSESAFNKFIAEYQNHGGFRHFSYDICDESSTKYSGLETIPVTEDGFRTVISHLYP